MKIFYSFLILVLALTLFSCSDDDNNNDNPTVTLENTSWERDMLIDGELHSVRLDFHADSFDFIFPNGAPVGHSNSSAKITYGTYNIKITEDSGCTQVPVTYSWGIDGNILSLATEGDSCTDRVEALMAMWTKADD
jgi:hypothetical protein